MSRKYVRSEVTRLVYGRYLKPVIIVYEVINMDIFLTKMHSFTSKGLY